MKNLPNYRSKLYHVGLEYICVHVCVPFQIFSVKGYEEEFKIAYAALLDIEGRTEEAIATLETINNMSSIWHLAQVSHWLLHNITWICFCFVYVFIYYCSRFQVYLISFHSWHLVAPKSLIKQE